MPFRDEESWVPSSVWLVMAVILSPSSHSLGYNMPPPFFSLALIWNLYWKSRPGPSSCEALIIDFPLLSNVGGIVVCRAQRTMYEKNGAVDCGLFPLLAWIGGKLDDYIERYGHHMHSLGGELLQRGTGWQIFSHSQLSDNIYGLYYIPSTEIIYYQIIHYIHNSIYYTEEQLWRYHHQLMNDR